MIPWLQDAYSKPALEFGAFGAPFLFFSALYNPPHLAYLVDRVCAQKKNKKVFSARKRPNQSPSPTATPPTHAPPAPTSTAPSTGFYQAGSSRALAWKSEFSTPLAAAYRSRLEPHPRSQPGPSLHQIVDHHLRLPPPQPPPPASIKPVQAARLNANPNFRLRSPPPRTGAS